MVALLVFAATLLVAVFLSELAQRSVLSTVHSSTDVVLGRRLYGQQPEAARA